ncbi:hypothetical protein D9M69_442540 [compost metagenome]
MTVAQAQQCGHGQVRARRFATDHQALGAEQFLTVGHQPQRGGFAVIIGGGIRVFRCQPVADADHRHVGGLGNGIEEKVLLVMGAQRPTAAMQVQQNPRRPLRREHTQRQWPGRTVNHLLAAIGRKNHRAEEGFATGAGVACYLGGNLQDGRQTA